MFYFLVIVYTTRGRLVKYDDEIYDLDRIVSRTGTKKGPKGLENPSGLAG